MDFTAIIVSAGKGERAKLGINKTMFCLDGKPLIWWCVQKFSHIEKVKKIIIATDQENYQAVSELFHKDNVKVVLGGKTRTNSVINALKWVETDGVLIHDGARPYVGEELINKVVCDVEDYGSGIPCTPTRDTIAIDDGGFIAENIRENAYDIQTPQGFLTKDIKYAYENLDPNAKYYDDSSVYRMSVKNPKITAGEVGNIKLTYPQDFRPMVVGTGFDMHLLVTGRDLILGGVKIPHTLGLLGHSDADVLTHAIMDAILSSLSLRDIGYHFPPSDDKYKDISSLVLLKHVLKLIDEKGYRVNNVSATIMAEKPKLLGYVPKITNSLATALGISPEKVGIGCTTLEGIGIVGREEGIASQAYVSLIAK